MIDLTHFTASLSGLAARIAGKPDMRWAVVTSVTPLTIRLDADDAPLLGTPSTLVAGLLVGDRVHVVIQNRRVTVIGKGGGSVGATSAEVIAGTDSTKFVTPKVLRDAVTTGTFTPASGWSIYTSHASYLLLRGTTARLTCTLQLATGGAISNLGSVPPDFWPPIATFAGIVVASNTPAFYGTVRVTATGRVDIPYYTNSLPAGQYVPMSLEWEI